MKKIITLTFFIFLYHIGSSQVWTTKTGLSSGNQARYPSSFSIPSLGLGFSIGGGTNNTWQYDTLADAWTQKVNYPTNTGAHVACSINGKGYVATGTGFGYFFDSTMYEYDPGANTWTKMPHFPGGTRAYGTGFAVGGKFYVGGGVAFNPSNIYSYHDFYSFDPLTRTWDTIQPYPGSGTQAAFAFTIGNKGYVGGGALIDSNSSSSTPGTAVADFWEYDPSTNTWTKKADFGGGPRQGASAFAFCDKGYAGIGINNVAQNTFTNDFWSYDPVNDKWKRTTDFPGAARAFTCTFVINKSAFVGLGDASPTYLDFYEFNPTYTPAFSAVSSICAGQSVSFTDTSNYSPTNWSWSFPGGTPSSSTIQNPVIQYYTAGNFDVVLTAWNGCDSATRTFSQYVTVGSGGTLTVTANPSFVCSGQQSMLSVTSGSGAYQWSPSAGLTDSTSASITVNPDSTTTYIVKQGGGGNCASIGQVTVTVGNNTIGGKVSAVRDTICQNTSGNLLLANNSSSTIQWQSSLNDSTFTSALHDTLTSYKTPPLTQSTWYRAAVGTGSCGAFSDTLKLIVPPALTASFYFAQPSPDKLNFNSDSSLGSIRSYHWDFGDGTMSTDSNPSHTYAKDSTYYVCLTLFDGSNCSYTFCKYSEVTDGIPTILAAANWVIYPNPFNEQLTIALGEAGRNKQSGNPVSQRDAFAQSIEMYNVLGQLVINKNLSNATNTSLQLNVSSLVKGMYYVMIRTADADYVQKVVKQ